MKIYTGSGKIGGGSTYKVFKEVVRVVREPRAFLAQKQPQRALFIVLQHLVIAAEHRNTLEI